MPGLIADRYRPFSEDILFSDLAVVPCPCLLFGCTLTQSKLRQPYDTQHENLEEAITISLEKQEVGAYRRSNREASSELSKDAAELHRLRKHAQDAEQLFRELADARNNPWKSLKHKQMSRLLYWLATQNNFFSERRRKRFLNSARKRDPKRSLLHVSTVSIPSTEAVGKMRAGRKKQKFNSTVLVASHEAKRAGAPILALNLIKELSKRHNVVTVVLGPGELAREFAAESVEILWLDRTSIDPKKIKKDVADLCKKYDVTTGFVNSVESRSVIPGLKSAGVVSVALLHEFAAYTRPMSAFREVFSNADQVVFSTNITLDNALEQAGWGSERPVHVHVIPQGKCETRPVNGPLDNTEIAWLDHILRPSGHQDDTFVVIGAGKVETRKGIDLFIEVANRVISGPGGGRFRFIWLGHGYDPVKDIEISAYLADQIERSGIQGQMKIVPSSTEIEHAYRLADLMLLSSRLDPLPNVAIDMFVAGKPVLCFARTTGIAALLEDAGLQDACVANFIDTTQMAEKIRRLAEDPALLSEVIDKSKQLARTTFDFASYANRLEKLAISGGKKNGQIKQDAKRVLASGAFRSDFHRLPGKRKSPEKEEINNYLTRNKSSTHMRKPAPGFNQLIYAEENGWGQRKDPFVAFIDDGQPSGRWKADVIDERSPIDDDMLDKQRVALHIHAFFPDELENILLRFGENRTRPTLFVSAPKGQLSEVGDILKSYDGPLSALRSVPNRGRDIGPFLVEFGHEMTKDFDIVGHLHTKKSQEIQDRKTIDNWVEFLMQNSLGGADGGAMLDRIITAMAKSPDLGIVYPDDPNLLGWSKNREMACQIAARMGIENLPHNVNYPMGTMFWARSTLIDRFLALKLDWSDFPAEPVEYDGTALHAFERLFGVAPTCFGFSTAVTNVRGLTR